jgi:septal ring factor EnvC (AmiA/AmiB activator)
VKEDPQSWGLLGISLLGLVGLLVTIFSRKGSSGSGVSVGPSSAQAEADQRSQKAEEEAEVTRKIASEAAAKEHKDKVEQQTTDLKVKTEEVKDDIDATNKTLVEIGKQIRGG